MKKITLLLIAVLFMLAVEPAHAAVPKLLTYQGVLKDGSGNFLTGTYSMVFRIYSASTGGTALWTETQSSVSTSSGKFSVQLGSVTTLSLDFSADYWLSVQIGSDAEMSPRIRLTSIGYSLRSDYENNGFTQTQHDALSHKGIEGVKDNTAEIAKTNFKLDAYSLASANSMGDMIVDTFMDSTGIYASASSNYTWRGSANYDVTLGEGGIDSNAKLVLHANGTNGSTTFTDSSTTANTVTASGNAQISTSSPKFGSGSGAFDGSGDYISVADSNDWYFGTGDFTIDFWIKFASLSGVQVLMQQFADSNNYWQFFKYDSTDNNKLKIQFSTGGTSKGDYEMTNSWSPSTGTWYHIAFVRSGSSALMLIDGVSQTLTTNTAFASNDVGNVSASLVIGGRTSYYANASFDEIRISKGIARWTAGFSPPSAEYSTTSSGTATVISNAYSVSAAPTEAMVIPDETLGTGSITYYVSRDNGTTWTTCTKETVTSISSQPSGTNVKWKAAITGNAELNAIAVAV